MLAENSTKTAPADNNCVEWARITLGTTVRSLSVFVDAVERLIQSIAHVTTKDIDRKIRKLRNFARCHKIL